MFLSILKASGLGLRQGHPGVFVRLDPDVLEEDLLGLGVVLQDGVDDVHARPLPLVPLLQIV